MLLTISTTHIPATDLGDVDPVGLVRNRRAPDGDGGLLAQYENDRPYVASSFLSVAIADLFGTAMAGRGRERQELAASAIPLEAHVAVLPCRGGESFLQGDRAGPEVSRSTPATSPGTAPG